jgi:uncharacterized protein (DUF2344 family)
MTDLRHINHLTAALRQWQQAQRMAVDALNSMVDTEHNAEKNYVLRKTRRLLKMNEIGAAIEALENGEWEP